MIVGWRSPIDGHIHDIKDFEGLGKQIPEPILRAIVHKMDTDVRHSGDSITITSGLSCPRKMLIYRMLPVTPDPMKMWAMQRGTWLHECVGLSLGENDAWWTEEVAPEACIFDGELFGVPMSCKLDALKKDYSTLVDWKFRNDWSAKYMDPSGLAKEEDCAQLNMARMLIEQRTGKDLSDMQMYVWVLMSSDIKRTRVPFMTKEAVARVRPGGGKHSIQEIFVELDKAMRAWQGAAEEQGVELQAVEQGMLQKIISCVPMVGQEMYKNKRNPSRCMCTAYCEVQEECFACEGGF